jgi:Asp-tRNA(Asn)/Glu-tRNA(Gln) amidotransferase A subunit family amidase
VLIGAKQLSPVEVFEAVRTRIEQTNPAINAIVACDFERAQGRGGAKGWAGRVPPALEAHAHD